MRYPPISSYKNETKNGKKVCLNCDNLVPKGFRKYCSHSCRQEFLRNHWWPLIREFVLERDKHICSICNKRKRDTKLDVDHIIPIKQKIDPFNKDNLRTLCKECHKAKTKLDNWAFQSKTY